LVASEDRSDNVIRSYRDKETEKVFIGERSRKLPPDIQQTARRKLRQLATVARLDDLRSPGGNRLEELKGDRKGTYSLRINDQWRITFDWVDGDAGNVGIEDYHR
jgi:proteic killer suppression protein